MPGEIDVPSESEPSSARKPSATSRVRHVSYNAESVDLIADTLGVRAGPASFRLPNAAVYQMVVPGTDDRPAAMLTLWPSIRRVDAIGSHVTAVITDIVGVELVDQVEVIFRRRTGEMLIVAIGGKLIVRA